MHTYIQIGSPSSGNSGGGVPDLVVIYDSGMVSPGSRTLLLVKGSKAGALFPKGAFAVATRVAAFLKGFSAIGVSVRVHPRLIHMCSPPIDAYVFTPD